MQERTVIIPAGGRAVRFDGILKELAPLPNDETPLQRALVFAHTKLNARRIELITSEERQHIHLDYAMAVLMRYNLANSTIHAPIQMYRDRDLLSAIAQGLSYTRAGALVLPDTVFDVQDDVLAAVDNADIAFGIFATQEPHRFSIIEDDGNIYTKQQLPTDQVYSAWGLVLWSKRAGQYMLENHTYYRHYDQLFQAVMNQFSYATFPLEYYYDLGSIDTYLDYLDTH